MLLSCYLKDKSEAGCDEAGRGCLAGAVFAAAVILPPAYTHPLLNDSKKLSEKQRYALRDIIEKEALDYAVSRLEPEEIDQFNILNASIYGMQKALDQLKQVPEHIIVDGNRFKPYRNIPYLCIVKGDAIYYSIAAASVLAKTYRDDYMKSLDREYPEYKWAKNKGYPTREHYIAIEKYGISPYHRKTFRLYQELKLF